MASNVQRLLDIRTRNNRFTVVVSEGFKSGYSVRYWSSPTLSRSPNYIDHPLSGSVDHEQIDTAIFLVYTQIEKLDGPITQVTENLLKDGTSVELFKGPQSNAEIAQEGRLPWARAEAGS